MNPNETNLNFSEAISMGSNCQLKLFEVYKNSIGIINDLRASSKQQMLLLSDVDAGLKVEKSKTAKEADPLEKLVDSINEFNAVIGDLCDQFTDLIEEMTDYYQMAIDAYEAKEGQFSKLIEARKQLLFLNALVRKYKFKINNLQLMNNVLLSFSPSLENAKDAYKSNLIYISTAMTSALEQTEKTVQQIETIN